MASRHTMKLLKPEQVPRQRPAEDYFAGRLRRSFYIPHVFI